MADLQFFSSECCDAAIEVINADEAMRSGFKNLVSEANRSPSPA